MSKYIIEIEDKPFYQDKLEKPVYKAKNFNTLVFDKLGLSKLEKYEEHLITKGELDEMYNKGYKAGLKDAKIIRPGDEVTADDGSTKFIATFVSEFEISGIDKDGKVYCYGREEITGKTGKHVDVICNFGGKYI